MLMNDGQLGDSLERVIRCLFLFSIGNWNEKELKGRRYKKRKMTSVSRQMLRGWRAGKINTTSDSTESRKQTLSGQPAETQTTFRLISKALLTNAQQQQHRRTIIHNQNFNFSSVYLMKRKQSICVNGIERGRTVGRRDAAGIQFIQNVIPLRQSRALADLQKQ